MYQHTYMNSAHIHTLIYTGVQKQKISTDDFFYKFSTNLQWNGGSENQLLPGTTWDFRQSGTELMLFIN